MRKMWRTNYNTVLKNSKGRDYLSTTIIWQTYIFSLLLTENPNTVICQVVQISIITLLRQPLGHQKMDSWNLRELKFVGKELITSTLCPKYQCLTRSRNLSHVVIPKRKIGHTPKKSLGPDPQKRVYDSQGNQSPGSPSSVLLCKGV